METKKVVLVGDAGVGKSTLIAFLTAGKTVTSYAPTLGVEVYPVFHQKPNGVLRRFNMWDCVGENVTWV